MSHFRGVSFGQKLVKLLRIWFEASTVKGGVSPGVSKLVHQLFQEEVIGSG